MKLLDITTDDNYLIDKTSQRTDLKKVHLFKRTNEQTNRKYFYQNQCKKNSSTCVNFQYLPIKISFPQLPKTENF